MVENTIFLEDLFASKTLTNWIVWKILNNYFCPRYDERRLNDNAISVIREQIGKHPTNVFTYKGNPIQKANKRGWRNALKRAGIENFRWHDLRHTWASWHVQNGTPLNALQELGGWADQSMVLRYAHLSSDHLKEYAKNVDTENKKNVTNLLHATNIN